ncbi:MAG: polysaccharide deacetylase family protein [bacterium]|nr:polysaccharide deacetylase family protein [bacterium]
MRAATAEERYHVRPLALRRTVNVLSVDVEHWYHRSCVPGTQYLLDVCDAYGVKATFFVLGKVAMEYGALVREMSARGHEVASHGWSHTPVSVLSPTQFRDEVVRTRDLLASLTGQPILGFRAPVFSISRETWWALDVLAECGMRYDSSVFPIRGLRYGIPDFPRKPVRYVGNGHSLIEIPLSTLRCAGINIPVSGGGYFRLLPGIAIRWIVGWVNREGLPFVTYCHPYEFERQMLLHLLPFTPFSWWGARRDEVKTNILRQTMRGKIARLLASFPFTTFKELLRDEI